MRHISNRAPIAVVALVLASIASFDLPAEESQDVLRCSARNPYEDYFPPAAIRRNLEGRVLIGAELSKTGRLVDAAIVVGDAERPSERVLNKAALRVVSELSCTALLQPVPDINGRQHYRISIVFTYYGDAPVRRHPWADLELQLKATRESPPPDQSSERR